MDQTAIISSLRAYLSSDGGMPLYRNLVAAIDGLIVSGQLKRGALLPSERDLANTLNISRVTVRKAFDVLIAEGVIRRRQGSRTEVTARLE